MNASTQRRDISWLAGPLFVVGVFFVVYVAAGLPGLQPSLRLLLGGAGVALAVAAGRGIAHPWPSALFWAGAFGAYAARAMGWAAVAGGVAASLVGAVSYGMARARRQKP